ncbi:MAG TPA: amidohydrolase family protein [Acidimicrobiales bacterium]|nr:amidohydrolase family protein [Acidimicrobiales bacterium]
MARPLMVSADEHLVEPPEFWHEWLPAHLPFDDRARAPRLDGVALVVDGRTAAAFELFPHLSARSDVQPGASDIEGRLASMDAEGIDIAVLFPQRAMGMFAMADRALMVACFDAYNEWLADLCARSHGRLYGVAVLPTVYEPHTTAAYIDRLKGLGFHTFMLPGAARGVTYAAPEMEPLWSAIEASGLPLCFHISESPDDNGPGGLGTYLTVSFQPFRKLWSYLVFSGLLERHPGLRIVFTEGGISWIPSALDHADRIHQQFADELDPRLPHPPSWYWYRQCYATFMDDPRGIEQLDHIGRDRVLWSRDYPHPEGTFGHSCQLVDSLVAELGAPAAHAIVGATAAAVFDFPHPAPVLVS